MSLPLTTVNVTPQVTLLYGAQGSQGQQIQIRNLSNSTVVWVGTSQMIQPGIASVPMNPGASLTFDGSISIYGCTATGQMQVAVVPGGVDYSPGTSVASIFMEPSPLIIQASSQLTPVMLVDVSQFSSYDLTCFASDSNQTVNGHALNFDIRLDWYDDTQSGNAVFTETWHPWILQGFTPASDQGVVASGPMHGQYLTITITNLNSHQFVLDYLSLYGSPRNTQLSDWRQNLTNDVHDATFSNIPNLGVGYDNTLGDTGGFIALPTGFMIMPLALYSGPVQYLIQTGAPLAGSYSIVNIGNQPTVTSGNISQSKGALAGSALAPNIAGELFLPRSACLLLVNISTAGSFNFTMTAQQGP